jgi:Ca2+:H+ antiporter
VRGALAWAATGASRTASTVASRATGGRRTGAMLPPPGGAAWSASNLRRFVKLRFLMTSQGWPYLLVPFIPIAIALELVHAGAVVTFFASALGVIPTAALMGRATEELAVRSGPGIGGLLNVTFGNAPELIIALFALGAGLHEVVKASIIGSIMGNVLLVLGAAMFFGGLKRDRQHFDRTAASAQSSMLLLAAAALVMPAIYELVDGRGLPLPGAERVHYDTTVQGLSAAVAVVLIFSYVAGLWFSLRTHRDLFNPVHDADDVDHGEPWTVRKSVFALAIAGVAVGVMSEILVDSISDAAKSLGLSEFFIGVIVVAIVGNAAEHWVAVLVAMKDKMDLAVNIAIGSSAQIALFVAPVLVLTSFLLGPHPMALVFNGFELGGILLAIIIANQVTNEGESTWYEGLQLLLVYVVLGIAFFVA